MTGVQTCALPILEMNNSDKITSKAPWTSSLETALAHSALVGNLRSLQKLALLIMVWLDSESEEEAINRALDEWQSEEQDYAGNRNEQIKRFCHNLAISAKKKYGTWDAAAEALNCTEKTLRNDASFK